MGYDLTKNIELYLLHAEHLREELSPNQKQYYLDAAAWLREQNFSTAEEAVAAMKQTPFYEGGALAKTADDIGIRIKAMKEVGYDDVAAIHQERKEKFDAQGNGYVFSSAWLDDYKRAGAEAEKYARRKEVFGKIFAAYVQITGNPQGEYRKDAEVDITAGIQELQALGVTFDQLAMQPVYRNLTMTTDKGMAAFVDFVHKYLDGGLADQSLDGIQAEQDEIAAFVQAHQEELQAVGKAECWKSANCIAVPADNEEGYVYIAEKVVE